MFYKFYKNTIHARIFRGTPNNIPPVTSNNGGNLLNLEAVKDSMAVYFQGFLKNVPTWSSPVWQKSPFSLSSNRAKVLNMAVIIIDWRPRARFWSLIDRLSYSSILLCKSFIYNILIVDRSTREPFDMSLITINPLEIL